jgi:hypothetical protein
VAVVAAVVAAVVVDVGGARVVAEVSVAAQAVASRVRERNLALLLAGEVHLQA